TFGERYFDAYIVVDADNLLESNYVEEMNKTFSQGYRVLTSYRNSKNYGTNWITSGYSLWFLREARFLNYARMKLHTSCAISGTGWMVASEIIAERGGWHYHTLTEDLEFTTDTILRGETIGYCGTAVLYDEQPETFAQSWRQRLRWSKGFLQIGYQYGKRMVKGIFTGKTPIACYDITVTIMPATTLAVIMVLTDVLMLCYAVFGPMFMPHLTQLTLHAIIGWITAMYQCLFVMGALTMLTEGHNIRATRLQKFVSLFTFPLFMMTYVPISIAAIFCKVEWKPIQHKVAKTLDEVR
ncbi:MAG: glycosyltransferase family 2 protein, partial [Butyricicoccaceae bacterium]